MNAKEQICNLALSRLGIKDTVKDLERPSNPTDRAFALWYDPCRKFVLKKLMPNFALARKIIAASTDIPDFGYTYAYDFPTGCLKVQGIGDVQDKENNYSVEGNQILTDEVYEDGLELRYIKDVTDTAQFTPEFIYAFSAELAEKVALSLTNDKDKLTIMSTLNKADQSDVGAMNGQENRPIRISTSRYSRAKTTDYPENYNKR